MSWVLQALTLLPLLVLAPSVSAAPAPTPSTATSPDALFQAANDHYLRGRYEAAVDTYGELLERYRLEDPAVYHNLGNAYFRSGAYGSAVLYYRRALRLEPSPDVTEALNANLDAARRTLSERYRASGDGSQFVYSEPGGLWYRVTHWLGPTALPLAFAALWFVLMGLAIARRVRPSTLVNRLLIPAAVVTALFGALLWGQVYTDANDRIGVIVLDGAKLRDGAHAEARGKDIPEGLEVRIVEPAGAWTRVELASGRQGWVDASHLKQI